MPSYAMLYHHLQGELPVCTTRILLFKITTFCLEYDTNSTAASITEAAVLLYLLPTDALFILFDFSRKSLYQILVMLFFICALQAFQNQ